MRYLIVLAIAVLAVAAACNPSPGPTATATATDITTGVRGVALAGPTCPVEIAGQSPCVRAVSGATIVALDSAGHEVARVVTDVAGAYYLRLAPGDYRIAPQAVSGVMGVPAQSKVTVPEGAPVRLDLQYDTGIR